MKSLFLAAALAASASAQSETGVAAKVASVFSESQSKTAPRVVEEAYEDEGEEYVAEIDPVRRALAFAAPTKKEARRLGGVYGLCADGVTVPDNGVLVCDPANSLPQICTLSCKQGFWSSGTHKDIACADAMCEGPCISTKYECKGSQIKFATRDCDVTRYVPCEGETVVEASNRRRLEDGSLEPLAPGEVEYGHCLETVTEQCSYSFYEEVSRPCCNYTQVLAPEDCWNSGCSGNCDKPGVYHYYSNSCSDVCPPWRDPDAPNFNCSPCVQPTLPAKAKVLESNSVDGSPASELYVGCEPGYYGNRVRSYCMSTDGSFFPPVSTIQCFKCPAAPELSGELFEAIPVEVNADGTVGAIEYRCINGFVGESTFANCDKDAGFWSFPTAPYCELPAAPSVSASASASAEPAGPEPSASETPAPTPSESATPSSLPTITPTRTPSASKSPRPPKVKGSRAPTQAPKLRVSAVPSSSASPVRA